MQRTIEKYTSKQEYFNTLKKRALIPEGFCVSTTQFDFSPEEVQAIKPYKMNLSLIVTEKPTALFHAVFTKNRITGIPVQIGKERLREKLFRGILINNKIANVCSINGRENAETLLKGVSELVGCPASQLWPCSTGIIGLSLPASEMLSAIPGLVQSLNTESILPVAQAIMTTDAYPKVRSISVGDGHLTGIAKGAGMIEPDMGTMLVFLLTDVAIPKHKLKKSLHEAVAESFNCISVDADQSTSDTVLLVSSGRKKIKDSAAWSRALKSVCGQLAEDIVRNGEGTEHVIKVIVAGSKSISRGAGKAIVNSSLVKTAINGNDPNIGRIVSALGSFLARCRSKINLDRIMIRIGPMEVFSKGVFKITQEKEAALVRYLKERKLSSKKEYPEHNKNVEIYVNLGCKPGRGNNSAVVFGSDLSCEYIRINAEYRT
jgi:glutamate N-acetyltransferase/amino-acid N-acetyltransferase